MTTVTAPATILLSGSSGYMGRWILRYLVDSGFNVVIAVRKESQGKDIIASSPDFSGKVTYVLVPDIAVYGAYDEAVKGVDGIIHTASPVALDAKDPQEVIGPAKAGALGILKSASEYGETVKRVVLTSSTLAILGAPPTEPTIYDETSWNTYSPGVVEEKGASTNGWVVYAASKVLAESSCWDWLKENPTTFDFTAIQPTFNIGPWLHETPTKDKLGSTLQVFANTLPTGETSGKFNGNWVDVRDAAMAHVLALKTEAAGGQRIIAANGPYAFQDIYDALIDAGIQNIPGKNTYGAGKNKVALSIYNNAKSLSIFPGFKYHTLAESAVDMARDLQSHGFL